MQRLRNQITIARSSSSSGCANIKMGAEVKDCQRMVRCTFNFAAESRSIRSTRLSNCGALECRPCETPWAVSASSWPAASVRRSDG